MCSKSYRAYVWGLIPKHTEHMCSSVYSHLCWYCFLNSWSVWVLWIRTPKSPRTHASMHPCTDENTCTDEPISIETHEAKYELHPLFGRTMITAAASHSVLWPLFRRTAFKVAGKHFQFCILSLVRQCSEQRDIIQFWSLFSSDIVRSCGESFSFVASRSVRVHTHTYTHMETDRQIC